MEVRKVHRAGGTSISMILPKDWVDRVDLQPGDVVGCVEQGDGSLAVRPHRREGGADRTLEMSVPEETGLLHRRVVSAYLRGYDRVRLREPGGLDGRTGAALRDAARGLVGLEVTERDGRGAVLEQVLETGELDPERGLRRMELITQGLVRTAADHLADPSGDLPPSLGEREEEVDQLARHIVRTTQVALRDAGDAAAVGLHPSDAVHHLMASRRLERTADHAYSILTLLQDRSPPEGAVRRDLADTLGEAGSLLEAAIRRYHDGDGAAANALVEEAQDLADDHATTLRRAAQADGVLVRVAVDAGRVASLAGDLAELALDRSVDPPESRRPEEATR